MGTLNFTVARRLSVAHQTEGECAYCDDKFNEIAKSFLEVLYARVWRCEVYSSGYHNGCKCGPDDPHGGWNCGYVLTAPSFKKIRQEWYHDG